MTTRQLLPMTLVVSLLLHGVAYAGLHAPAPVAPRVSRTTQLRFDVAPRPQPQEPELAKPEPPKPEPPKPEPPKPEPLTPKLRAAEPQAPAPEPTPPEPAPPVTPSTGVTLAAEGSANAFSMPLGNGGSLEPSPPAPSRAVLSPPLPPKPLPAAPREPPLVGVGDLSARPSPPSLAAALERNYPSDARRRGLSGSAKVRARIDPDGVVRRVTLLEESGAGFGTACSRTLTGSRWAAPKDKAGRQVATEIRYTCRFVVEP